jgi:hypothetical protein
MLPAFKVFVRELFEVIPPSWFIELKKTSTVFFNYVIPRFLF